LTYFILCLHKFCFTHIKIVKGFYPFLVKTLFISEAILNQRCYNLLANKTEEYKMKYLKIISALAVAVIMFSGFWSGESNSTLRKERIMESKKTLELLYKYAPQSRRMIANSYGYATFSNIGVNVILLSAEGGKGLAHNNKTGKNTYMNMGSGGVGVGLGVKDFRAIFLFENKEVFDSFVNSGWEANAQADAAAKVGKKGGALNAAITVAPGIRLYKLTQNGLALQATIQGTKYWKDADLN
jgi:lipid-binding SYLF domain-containing protein